MRTLISYELNNKYVKIQQLSEYMYEVIDNLGVTEYTYNMTTAFHLFHKRIKLLGDRK